MIQTNSKPRTPNAIIYRRVSTSAQVDSNSFLVQEQQCLQYCQNKGWDVVGTFDDPGRSAKNIDRQEFQRLLAYCKKNKGKVDYLVVFNTDRFTRDARSGFDALSQLQRAGVKLRSVTQHLDETPEGKKNLTNSFADAQYSNDLLSQRVTLAMIAAAEDGRWARQAPIGFTNTNARGILAPDPERASLIGLAFKDFATGRYSQAQVLDKLTNMGLSFPGGRKISKQEFGKILKREVYAGRIVHHKWGIDVKAKFDGIVDTQTFGAVQAVLTGKKVIKPRADQNPLCPLKNFAKCEACGGALTGARSIGKNKNRGYVYYWCYQNKCVKGIPADQIHDEFVAFLEGLRLRSDFTDLILSALRDVWLQASGNFDEQMKMTRRREKEVEAKRDNIDEALANGLSLEAYTRVSAKIGEELHNIQFDLEQLRIARKESSELDVDAVIGYGRRLLATGLGHEWFSAEIAEKHRCQLSLFPRGVRYSRETGFSEIRTPEDPSIFSILKDLQAEGVREEQMVRPE